MSSSKTTPFQDITNKQTQDPKEIKRQRERERYAKNKDNIAKRWRELRELKKNAAAPVNDENSLCDTQAIGQSGVTQIQYMATDEAIAPDDQQFPEPHSSHQHVSIPFMGGDDESEWLHKNSAYQMKETPRGMRPIIVNQPNFRETGVDDAIGSDNVSVQQTKSLGTKQQTAQGWYARLPADKKAEYLLRQRIARQQKKAATSSAVSVSQTSAASLQGSPRTPLTNVINTIANGTCANASLMSIDQQTTGIIQDDHDLSGQSWYARLTEEQKTDHLMKMRVSWQQIRATLSRQYTPGAGEIGSAYSAMTNDVETPSSESTMEQMHTSAGSYGQESFIVRSASSEKRRQRAREMYTIMTDEQRQASLRKKRDYKKCRRETSTSLDHVNIVAATDGDAFTPLTTPVVQAQSSKNMRKGIVGPWSIIY